LELHCGRSAASPARPKCSRMPIALRMRVHVRACVRACGADLWKPVALAVGCLLFFTGPQLSQLSSLHYTLGSFMAIVLLFTLVMRRPGSVGLPAAGGIIAMLVARPAGGVPADSLASLGVAGAVVAVAVGLVTVYVVNPMQNPRLCNLVQWTLQGTGLVLTLVCTSDALQLRANVAVAVVLASSPVWTWPCRRWGRSASPAAAASGDGEEDVGDSDPTEPAPGPAVGKVRGAAVAPPPHPCGTLRIVCV
jgi:hypothetical protein